MSPSSYSRAQIALHWLTLLAILVAFFSHEMMKDAFRVVERGGTAATPWLHVGAGIAVLLFGLWRLALRLSHGAPQPLAGQPKLAVLGAALVHGALYLLVLLMPLSGSIAWFLGVEDAGEVHEALWLALQLLVLAHVLAALYHQFIRKDGLMRRMLRAD